MILSQQLGSNDFWIIGIGMVLPFLATVFGASIVFFIRGEISKKTNSVLLGFAAGIMVAASIWSLIMPSYNMAGENWGDKLALIPVVIGFILGALLMYGADKLVPHIHKTSNIEEGIKTKKLSREAKLFFAMTIHNIPEGLAVGFAFAVAVQGGSGLTILGAFALAIGISLQDIPEGAAVSLPMAQSAGTKKKAFAYGALSAVVEPIGAVAAFFFATFFADLLPWFLSFAAGAMMYVVVEELIPEAKLSEDNHLGTFAVLGGFVLMMILDLLLG